MAGGVDLAGEELELSFAASKIVGFLAQCLVTSCYVTKFGASLAKLRCRPASFREAELKTQATGCVVKVDVAVQLLAKLRSDSAVALGEQILEGEPIERGKGLRRYFYDGVVAASVVVVVADGVAKTDGDLCGCRCRLARIPPEQGGDGARGAGFATPVGSPQQVEAGD